METIMRFNIFKFGNLRIHQLRGTAMGTSSACIWATIYYAIHENKVLLPRYGRHLYKRKLLRFIDDIWAIWIFEPGANRATSLPWKAFCKDLSFGRLTWKVTRPSRHAIFLDLNLYIVRRQIKTTTYQKELNLYLYLPGSSAHTLGMIKGTIYGQLLCYYEHNNANDDYLKVACLLRSPPESVTTDYVQIPQAILERHQLFTLAVDVMFVNGVPFLVSVARGLNLVTAEFTPSRTAKQLAAGITRMIDL
jgi:hypothetical protein